jgi:bla regulator protein BlaR1
MSGPSLPWLVETLVTSTLLMALVLLLRKRVVTVFGAHLGYALWILPGARMVLPPLPHALVSKAPRLPSVDLSAMPPVSVGPAAMVAQSLNLPLVLFILWLGGVAAHFLWQVITHHRFLNSALAASALIERADGVSVRRAPVSGPVAAGVIRRHVFLPKTFEERFAPEERRLALAHEIAHHRRGDLAVNWLALVVLSLHWFNPIAHAAYRAFRVDQELACDATVLAGASGDERYAYGSAVVKATCARVPAAACALRNVQQLKRRLMVMAMKEMSPARRSLGRLAAVALLVLGLASTASVGAVAARATPDAAILLQPVSIDTAPPLRSTTARRRLSLAPTWQPERAERTEAAERPEQPERPELPERPEQAERPEIPERPEQPEQPEVAPT